MIKKGICGFAGMRSFRSFKNGLLFSALLLGLASSFPEAGNAGKTELEPGLRCRAIVMLHSPSTLPKGVDMGHPGRGNVAAAEVAKFAECEVSRYYSALSMASGHPTMVMSKSFDCESEEEFVGKLRLHPFVYSAEVDRIVSVPPPPLTDDAVLSEGEDKG